MNTKSLIERADDLMSSGKIAQAKELVRQHIEAHPKDKSAYSDAVNVLMAGNLTQDAKKLFNTYYEKTGNKLDSGFNGSDFSIAQIEQQTIKQNLNDDSSEMTYKTTYLYRFNSGIKEITVTPEHITIIKRGKSYTAAWNKISDAKVVTKQVNGGNMIGTYLRNTVQLIINGKNISFETSPNVPSHFVDESEGKLLPVLKKYIKFDEVRKQPGWVATHSNWIRVVIVVMLLIFLIILSRN